MTLHLHLYDVYCHSRSLWVSSLSSGHWVSSLSSEFSVLDSGFCFWLRLCPKLNVRFAWKFVSFMCVCACVGFVLCCLCLLLCGSQWDSQKRSYWRYLIHDMLTILIYLLCAKISCMIWPLPPPAPAPAPELQVYLYHTVISCPYAWIVYECIRVYRYVFVCV